MSLSRREALGGAAALAFGITPRHWDETRFLAGTPGRQVVIARRAGKRWFVAGLNADTAPATLALDLAFVGDGRGWLTTDGDTPRAFVRRRCAPGRSTPVTLAARGGFLAEFTAR
jgi:hypothetical protein